MATFTTTTPFVLGKALLKSWLDKVFDNTTLLRDGKTKVTLGELGPAAISPSALSSADTHNWNPTGLHAADGAQGIAVVRVTTNGANSFVTGIQAPTNGSRLVIFQNIGPTGVFGWRSENVNSSAENRITSPEAYIGVKACVILYYDLTLTRWVVVAS